MRKRLALALCVSIGAISLTACGGAQKSNESVSTTEIETTVAGAADTKAVAVSSDEYTELSMKIGTSSAETTLTAKAFRDWAARMSEKTGGKVTAEVFPSSVLGNNTEMVQGAQMGTIDVVAIQPGGIADMGATKVNLLVLPFLFENYDQYTKTLFGEIGDELLQDITDNVQGMVGFSYLPDSGRCYFTAGKGIYNLDDIKGMKLRVQPYEIDTAIGGALGFSPTPVAYSELYSSLQTGVVEGAENSISGIDGPALYEVSDYLTLDNHTYNIPVLTMSKKTWDNANDATKALLKSTWMETVNEYYIPELAKYEEEALKKFEGAGVEVIRELEDYDKWVEAVQPIWQKFGGDVQDLIAKVQANK